MFFSVMTLPNSTTSILALWLIPGLGPQRIMQILERYDPIESVFFDRPREIQKRLNVDDSIAQAIHNGRESDDLKRELALIETYGLVVIDRNHKDYPTLLKEVYSAPPILYTKGNADLNSGLHLAFVGSRKASYYGKSMCRKLIKQLAGVSLDITIISGLAMGIDREAHTAALENGLKTIAVLAGGLSSIYPARHKELADQICQQGALVTEFPVNSKPIALNFPLRNRIISGMSRGVVVVEAGQKSGASITAGYAIEQNRELFALPGPADSTYHVGTNRFIQKGQAKLILDANDILDELNTQLRFDERQTDVSCDSKFKSSEFSGNELKILECLKKGSLGKDKLASKLDIPIQELLVDITSLELKGVIICKPGQIIQLSEDN